MLQDVVLETAHLLVELATDCSVDQSTVCHLAGVMVKLQQKGHERRNYAGRVQAAQKRSLYSTSTLQKSKRSRAIPPAQSKCLFEVGCSIVLRRNSKTGIVVSEKAGGWRVVRFHDDDSVGRYRPSDLWSACKSCDGMRRYDENSPEFLTHRHHVNMHQGVGHIHHGTAYADENSHGNYDCSSGGGGAGVPSIRMGDRVLIRKSRKVGVIVDEKPGGWRVVDFQDGAKGTYRPSEFIFVPKDQQAPQSIVVCQPKVDITVSRVVPSAPGLITGTGTGTGTGLTAVDELDERQASDMSPMSEVSSSSPVPLGPHLAFDYGAAPFEVPAVRRLSSSSIDEGAFSSDNDVDADADVDSPSFSGDLSVADTTTDASCAASVVMYDYRYRACSDLSLP